MGASWLSSLSEYREVLGVVGSLIVVSLAWSYRRRWLSSQREVLRLTLVVQEKAMEVAELTHEADYWRGLVKWQQEHRDREPTTEELDAIWQRITEQARYTFPLNLPIGTLAHPIVTPNGDKAWASTISDLIGGRE